MKLRLVALWCLFRLAAGSICVGGDPDPTSSDFRIVGYLPNYRAAEFDPVAAKRLTDLIVFSAEPSTKGSLDLNRVKNFPWDKLQEFKTQNHARLILCVGGWERSKNFPAVATSVELRAKFVKSAVQACFDKHLDGLDLDWEHPKTEAEQNGYAALLKELRTAFQEHKLKLSVTMAAWQKLPPEAFAAVDTVNIMAYDNQGKHSTYESAVADVKKLIDQGVPAEKIVLGLPFYGRHLTKRNQVLTYSEIVDKYKPAPEIDEVESLYFNGPQTIRKKTTFALENKLGGVMFWELGQDAKGEQSLLRVINDAVKTQQQ